jgi:serine/threonine protein kinase
MLNTNIKDYLIQSELGRGGMAVVYLAHDSKFDTNVAVKLLNKEYVHNDNIRKRFLAEARNMFRMSHPNIIKVTDLIDDGDTVAFVMEYIEGETLKEYLESRGKLGDDEIKSLFIQMLDALDYVHEQKLVHRDIKPSNFMITPNGKVKLMDFGIAKQTDPNSSDYTSTGTTQQMGTPMYMSPEQVHETKNVTAQSDIYSLGVVLWQMVTGKRPYDTKTLSSFQLESKIVNEPLDKTNSHSDELIQKATAKDIAIRYKSCKELKKAVIGKLNENSFTNDETIIDSKVEKNEQEKSKQYMPGQATTAELKAVVASEKKSKGNAKIIGIMAIGAIILGFIIISRITNSQNERALTEEYRSYRNIREDNGKVYLTQDLWETTVNKGLSIDYRKIYEETPGQIVFPFSSKDILNNAINKGCFPRWLKKNEQGRGLEISIWDEKPVYIGYNSKNELIVFYTDGTAQNTVTQETKTWSCN